MLKFVNNAVFGAGNGGRSSTKTNPRMSEHACRLLLLARRIRNDESRSCFERESLASNLGRKCASEIELLFAEYGVK